MSTPSIENIYARFAPDSQQSFEFVTRAQIEEGIVKKERLLLPSGAQHAIAKGLGVPELSGELERAIWQVKRAAKKEEEELRQKEPSSISQHIPADEKHRTRK